MLDTKIQLIQQKASAQDNAARSTIAEQITTVFGDVQSPTRSEYYKADQSGFVAAAVIRIYTAEYSGQPLLRFDGKTYKVRRTYRINATHTELTCEEVR